MSKLSRVVYKGYLVLSEVLLIRIINDYLVYLPKNSLIFDWHGEEGDLARNYVNNL